MFVFLNWKCFSSLIRQLDKYLSNLNENTTHFCKWYFIYGKLETKQNYKLQKAFQVAHHLLQGNELFKMFV
jgi:hypothetical protein